MIKFCMWLVENKKFEWNLVIKIVEIFDFLMLLLEMVVWESWSEV